MALEDVRKGPRNLTRSESQRNTAENQLVIQNLRHSGVASVSSTYQIPLRLYYPGHPRLPR